MSDPNHQELIGVLRTMLKIQAFSAVRDLPSKKDKILFLAEAGLSHKEVSEIVNTTPQAVRQAVYAAKKNTKADA